MLNGLGERFMSRYDPARMERTTRDIMSRSSYQEMMAGRGGPEGGVYIFGAHLGPEFVEKNFPGMCERCRQFHFDLARKPVPVTPTAHFVMGGAAIDPDGRTSIGRLFAAGEDAGGVHGANRLGGNGIAESCVYGRRAGKAAAVFLREAPASVPEPAKGSAAELETHYLAPFSRPGRPAKLPFELRLRLRDLNWNKVGVGRREPDLSEALAEFAALRAEAATTSCSGTRAWNMAWNAWIDLGNLLDVSQMTASSARLRRETRGAHFRLDFPEQNDAEGCVNHFLRRGPDGNPVFETRPVAFTLKTIEECRAYTK